MAYGVLCIINFMHMETDIELKNKKIIEAYFYEVWNKGDFSKLNEIIHDDYLNHNPSAPNPPRGPSGLVPIISEMRSGISDLNYTIEDLIITNDHVVARVTVTGTQAQTLWGIPPTGKNFKVSQINIERIQGGKIIEHWRVTEELKLFQQLGLVS